MKSVSIFVSSTIVFAILLGSGKGYKILGIFPTPSPSHYFTGSALMKGLAAAGHEVTVISPFPQARPLKNYRDITIDGVIETMSGMVNIY